MEKFYYIVGIFIVLSLFAGCAPIRDFIAEDLEDTYDFRETKWGYTLAHVEFVERGRTKFFRTPDLLVYKTVIDGIPLFLVYSFKDNKLRAAGYMTQKPIIRSRAFIKDNIEKHGEPTHRLSSGLMWRFPKSVLYIDGYTSHIRQSQSSYRQADGVLEPILKVKNQSKDEEHDFIIRWDGVMTYIDRNFYAQLAEEDYPLLQLSHYEKRLFGVLKRRASISVRTQTGDTVTIPVETNIEDIEDIDR